jgi:hypothetical protein
VGDHPRAGCAELGNLSVQRNASLFPALCADVCGCLLLLAIMAIFFVLAVGAKPLSTTFFAVISFLFVRANAASHAFLTRVF